MSHCLCLILMHVFISEHVYGPCKAHMTPGSKSDNQKPKKNKVSQTAGSVEAADAGIDCFDSPKNIPSLTAKNNTKEGKPQRRV